MCEPENELVSKQVEAGKVDKVNAIMAAGAMKVLVEADQKARRERERKKRYIYGNNKDRGILIDDEGAHQLHD